LGISILLSSKSSAYWRSLLESRRHDPSSEPQPCHFAWHKILTGVHKDALLWIQHRRQRKETWHRLLASGTLSLHQDRLHALTRQAYGEIPSVRQCQKCQKGIQGAFGTFGTPSVSALQESHALLGERRSECPGAVPILVGVALPAQPQVPPLKGDFSA
jgi:hypothetical protein